MTQTFSAEYGGNGGGVIEAVTKSGSNHFHGSLFELHRDASLDAKNYFDLGSRPIPPFVRNQFGVAIGGPLVHDRAFFFANYQGFREVQAYTAIATVPNEPAHRGLLPSTANPGGCGSAGANGCVAVRVDPRVQQFLELLPPSNGAQNGDGTGDLITVNKGATTQHHGMFRIDHNFSNTHSLFARYVIDDSSSLVPYLGHHRELTSQDSQPFTKHAISTLLFRTVGVSDTTCSTNYDSTSTARPRRLQSSIRIRGFLFLWCLADR